MVASVQWMQRLLGQSQKLASQVWWVKLFAAAARRPVRAKTARESCSNCVQGDEDSDEEPPALRRRSEHRAAAASAGAGPSGAGPSSPAAASHSIPDELSGDEFDEEAEAAFRETPHRMEGDRRADFADREEDSEVDAALDALRTRQADDQSDWSSSLDADSPRRTQPPQPPQPQPPPPPQQLADEEDDDSWAHQSQVTEKRGGSSRPHIRVFGAWFDLNDTAKIQPIRQFEEGEEEEAEEAAAEDDAVEAGGGEGAEGADLTPPEKLTLQAIGTAKWVASACCIVIDARLSGTATGGREPRIISFAASHVSGGEVLDSWHEYVKIDQPADAAAVRGVHGLDFLTLQEQARDSFKAVGARWINWLRSRIGAAKTVSLVTAGGLKGGVYTALASELARASLSLPSATWIALDVVHAARLQKVFAHVAISEWPCRKKATAAQVKRAGMKWAEVLCLTYALQSRRDSI